jgi:hypothetical protein
LRRADLAGDPADVLADVREYRIHAAGGVGQEHDVRVRRYGRRGHGGVDRLALAGAEGQLDGVRVDAGRGRRLRREHAQPGGGERDDTGRGEQAPQRSYGRGLHQGPPHEIWLRTLSTVPPAAGQSNEPGRWLLRWA